MKILVVGSNGFLGRYVSGRAERDHTVIRGTRNNPGKNEVYLDGLKKSSIIEAIKRVNPQVIVNCAGVVENSNNAKKNVKISQNIIQSIVESDRNIRFILTGSAAEYGVVNPDDLPIPETYRLKPIGEYAKSKQLEVKTALNYAKKYHIKTVVARVFNPLGPNMHEKFLTSRILDQLSRIEKGIISSIELFRLDSLRDYIDIRDVAEAYACLINNEPKHEVYNVGSGRATSNEEIVNELVRCVKLPDMPILVQTSVDPEPFYACQADIRRMQKEFGWNPTFTIHETLEEIANAKRKI